MTAKEYFKNVLEAERELKRLAAAREHQMELATSITPQGEGEVVSHSRGAGIVESSAVMLAMIGEELDQKTSKYAKLIRQAMGYIDQLKSIRERELLTLRYICAKPWKEVQTCMGYEEEKSLYRLHGWALEHIQDLMGSE